ncbi:MAG: hypothetical protein AAF654_01755 [Myxococcota bacterium]
MSGVGIPSSGGLEHDAFVGQLTSQGVSAEAAAATAQRIDADGDGVVTRDEAQTDFDQMVANNGGTDEGLNTVQVNFSGGPSPVNPTAADGTGGGVNPIEAFRRGLVDVRAATGEQEVTDAAALLAAIERHLAQAGVEDAGAMAQQLVQMHVQEFPGQPFTHANMQSLAQGT